MINANPVSGNAITVNGTKFIVDYQGNTTINGNFLLNNASSTLQLPAGSAANPSLTFTGNTTSGLAATATALSFITNNTEQMKITTGGTITIDSFTTSGVVHNDASGNLSTSLIVDADISSSAAITDTKLATISTPGKVANSATTATNTNTPSTIVARDSSGNFSANVITASLIGNVTGTASGNLPLSGGTLTGNLTLPAGSSAVPSLQFTGSTNTGISAPVANTLSFDVNGTEAMNINSSGQITIDGLNSAGVVHTNASGLLSTSLIVNSDITTGTIANNKLATISSSDIPGDIVVRDGSGNFATNMITLDGTTTNATDAATKAYVDSVAGTGIVIHPPAEVVSTSPITTLEGSQTIDGVTVGSGNRVLLTDQTSPNTNGLWVATSTITSPWFRPTDFANGSPAGNAYVLITEGNTEAGSRELCSTPTAIIGSSPIFFQQFSLPSQVNGANVGSGTGLVFQNKSGVTLNFRSLADGQYMNITTSPTVVTIATNATSLDIPSTLVARDASGNFAAGTITATTMNVTGNETIGGTLGVTGITTLHNTLNLTSQSGIDLHDLNTGNYVGLKAPATVNSNYTLLFPASSPTASQILQANAVTPTQLEWVATPGATSPSTSRTIYVTTYGNDTTGDGSFTYPYASLAKAVTVANAIATVTNPLIISIAPGTYIENNSAGPITLTTGGVTIAGQSASATFIEPSSLSKDLLAINPGSGGSEIRVNELTFQCAGGSTASAISLAGIGTNAILSLIQIFNFNTGISMGGTNGDYLLFNGAFEGNNTAIAIDNVGAVCNSCVVVGSSSTTIIPANTGISVTGSAANIIFSNGLVYNCSTGALISNNANVSFDQCTFRNNNNTVIQNSAATAQFLACDFSTNPTSGINIQASGAGTATGILGCYFNGLNFSGSPQGTAIQATSQANVNIAASEIIDYITGMQAGSPSDTSSTSIFVSASTEVNNLTHDIIQNGSSTLIFNGTADGNKISINDPTNVELNYFNLIDNTLAIGKLANVYTPLIDIAISPSNNPRFVYNPAIYSTQGLGYQNPQSSPSSFFALSGYNTNFTAITTDRTKVAGLRLVSDTSMTIGNGATGLRGWDINKNASTAQLSFSYQNSDSGDGQSIIPQYTLMQLDGVNNQVQLPTTSLLSPTEIVFGGDTYVYRSAANTLKTSGNFVVDGSLTVAPLPAHSVLLGEASNPISSAGPGTAGQLLMAAGASADPKFVTPTAGNGLTVSSSPSQLSYGISAPVSVANGGTGATSFTTNGIVVSGATSTSALTSKSLLSGQLLIGSTGAAPVAAALTAGSGITITPGAGSITIASSASSGITTLAGDIGSATGSTVTLNANTNAGATVKFSGSGSTMNLLVTSPTTLNTFIGLNAGNTSATGTHDTALGYQALNSITTGGSNIAVGYQAGSGITTGANNIHIGTSIPGVNESTTIRIGTEGTQTACYIAGIRGVAIGGGGQTVQVNGSGQLGTTTSSKRYKENITPLASVTDQLTQLEPVKFTYKIDHGKYPQYGLIAEDVYDIYPEWIIYDKEGEIYSVNYAFLPPVLLKGWQEQQTIIEKQQQQIDALCKRCLVLEEKLAYTA